MNNIISYDGPVSPLRAEELRSMAGRAEDHKRQTMRDNMRKMFALSNSATHQISLRMALAGYGVDDIMAKTGLDRSDARKLVLGVV